MSSPTEDRPSEITRIHEELRAEVHERLRTEKALWAEKFFCSSILNATPAIVCGIDPSGVTRFINPAGERITGYTSDELVGQNWWEKLYPGRLMDQVHRLMEAFKGGDVRNYQMTLQTRMGESRTIEWNSFNRCTEQGQLIEIIGFGQDVTEERKARAQLEASEARYRTLFEHANDAIFLMDGDHFIECNQKTSELFACSPEDILGHHPSSFSPTFQPDGRPSVEKSREYIQKALEGEAQNFEWVHQRMDGQLFDAEVSLNRIQIKKDIFLQAIVRDVSDRTRSQKALLSAEQALRASEHKYRQLVEQLNEGIVAIDLEMRVVFINPRMMDLLGYSPEELIGRPFVEIVKAEEQASYQKRVRNRVYGISEKYELTVIQKDGSERCFLVSGTPLRDGDGTITGAFAVFTDMTEFNAANEALRKSEAKFRGVVENMQDVYYRANLHGQLEIVSPSAAELLGYPSGTDLTGWNTTDGLYFDTQERERFKQALFTHGKVSNYELLLRNRDGKAVLTSTNSHLLFDKDGQPVGIEGVVTDVTERKRSELALQESEAKLRRIIQHTQDIIYSYRVDGVITFVSDSIRRFGYEPQEILGINVISLLHEEDRIKIIQSMERAINSNLHERVECRLKRKDGQVEWIEEYSEPMYQDGELVQINGVVRVITARKQAEEALRESEKNTRRLLEHLGEGVLQVDLDERVEYANPAAESLFGVDSGGLVGRCLADFSEPSQYLQFQRKTRHRIQGEIETYEAAIRRLDGTQRQVLITATPSLGPNGAVQGILGVFRDITEWKQAEADRQLLFRAMEYASDATLITSSRGQILYANHASASFTGYPLEELTGHPIRNLFHLGLDRETYRDILERLRSGLVWSGKLHLNPKDRQALEVNCVITPIRDDQGRIVNHVVSARDITREAELEIQLRHAQKMEAIGVLAGGIAHDFNNILTPILGYAELAAERSAGDSKTQGYIEEIFSAGKRAADLVQQILTFSRQGEQKRSPVEVASILKESLKLIRAAIPRTIAIETDIHPQTGQILADPSQIHQIIMNLCTNAFHAMKQTGGKLSVRLASCEVEVPIRASGLFLPEGSYVKLDFVDTGVGMDPETLKKVFLPFFTTKRIGEGTGLGLAIVHGIVTGAGGGIEVWSELGKGTTFSLYFPRIESQELATEPTHMELPKGHGRILVVDDELSIIELLFDALSMMGFQIKAMPSSLEALIHFERDPMAFDMVLSDLTMPDLTGVQLAQRMWMLRPELPILLMTGFSDSIDEEGARRMGFRNLLRKPVALPALAQALMDVMTEGPAASAPAVSMGS